MPPPESIVHPSLGSGTAWSAVMQLAENRLPGLVPQYVQDDPTLAGVNDDDTIIEVAAIMARLRCPLAVVMRDREPIGVITASRLPQLALTPPPEHASS